MPSRLHFCLVAAASYFVWLSRGQQIPLAWVQDPRLEVTAILDEGADPAIWDIAAPLSRNTTGRFIFDTASSLLQHWPNTRYPNGHTIIPGTIAPGTLLYHGTAQKKVPDVPEWTATDPEHAHLFCWGSKETGCWQLTLVATRHLKVLYFDGSSAAKMRDGAYDSQDLVVAGEVLEHKNWSMESERSNLAALCAWGEPFEIDGFLRMEPDFEVMLCNFTSGLTPLSFLNIVPERESPSRRASLSHSPRLENLTSRDIRETMYAGHWHNHYPGETRILLDYSRLLSFYDLALAPSLASAREGKERGLHRLKGIASADVHTAIRTLKDALSRTEPGSGVDWPTLFQVVVQRYADRLKLVQQAVHASESQTDTDATTKKVQTQLRVILNPYLLHSARPPSLNSSVDLSSGAWAASVFKLCATSHTAFLASPAFEQRLTREEHVLRGAVEEVNTEICRVATRMWVAGVLGGADTELGSGTAMDGQALLGQWAEDIDGIIGWLDWSIWVRCRPACSDEEECYLPTWPFWRKNGERERMEPRCIRRIEPFPDSFP